MAEEIRHHRIQISKTPPSLHPLERIYNIDESGFAIGASQSLRALINVRERSS
ncbi:MAG: hypothetical protein FE78DRAFT_27124 [Acidomyces sp. 'richmondensis']|nr:MAG: hypothetical protein FE78DRAFT_27124 [Acidomyces sp. 'richmondensis']